MPKEQGHFGEQVGLGSSKNAKDKSNSATVRASQCGIHRDQAGVGDMGSSRMSRCDSEKDSGYSEAGSDSLQTDLDDEHSGVSEPHRESGSRCNNHRGNATGCNMPTYKDLTPVYVIKNLVVKPSRPKQLLPSPLAWGEGWHSLTGAKAPTQLLLIPQPAIPVPSPAPTTASSLPSQQGQPKKGGSRSNKNHSSRNSYLPILNSYPRIAPYPRREGHEQGRGGTGVGGVKESGSEGQSQSKKVCTEKEKRETVSTTSHLLKPQQQHHHQREGRAHSQSQYQVRGGNSSCPNPSHNPQMGHASTTHPRSHRCHKDSRADSVGSPSISSSQTPSLPSSSDSPSSSSPSSSATDSPYRPSPEGAATISSSQIPSLPSSSNSPSSSSSSSSATDSPYRPSPEGAAGSLSDSQSECSSIHQRRFHNTTEILSQSGLLTITLRTKELLRQNAATEREIAQLRQHTQLLCQVAEAGQQGPKQGYNDRSNTLDKLLQAMTQSGSYPNLDLHQLKALNTRHQQAKKRDEVEKEKDRHGRNNKADDSPPQNLVSLNGLYDRTSPPSPLFAPSPEPQGTEHTDGLPEPLTTSHSLSITRLSQTRT